MQIKQNIIDTASELKMEETSMIDKNVCPANGEPKEISPALEKADALLLYQAKLNVRKKKNMIKNLVAYISTWIVLGFLFEGVFANRTHPQLRWLSRAFAQLNGFAPDNTTESYWLFHSAVNNIESYFLQNYTLPIWNVILGVMLAWGCWIAIRIVKYTAEPLAKKIRAKFIRDAKPDPVIQEYNRLKNMANEGSM